MQAMAEHSRVDVSFEQDMDAECVIGAVDVLQFLRAEMDIWVHCRVERVMPDEAHNVRVTNRACLFGRETVAPVEERGEECHRVCRVHMPAQMFFVENVRRRTVEENVRTLLSEIVAVRVAEYGGVVCAEFFFYFFAE